MNIKIIELKIYSDSGIISFPFSPQITYIYGNIGVGKTTLLSLIMYCLGGDLVDTPAVSDQFASAELYLEINLQLFAFRREYLSSKIFVKNNEGKVYNFSKKEITNFLFEQSNIDPIYYEQRGVNTPNQLTLKNYLWYSYLCQSDIDSNFFYLNKGANEFYQIASTNILASLLGTTRFINSEQRKFLRTNKKRLSKYENGIEALNYVLSEDLLDSIMAENSCLESELAYLLNLRSQSNSDPNELLFKINAVSYQLNFIKQFIPIVSRHKKFFQEYYLLERKVQEFSDAKREPDMHFERNLFELGEIFKECLISVGFPSVSKSDKVSFHLETLNPTVKNEYTNISYCFDSLGSGGKKTLFKICFLMAVHIKAKTLPPTENRLPSFIIIDTPMKNISEREDKALFDNFYTCLIGLFQKKLSGTQLIIVDKERNYIIEKSQAKVISINKEKPLFSGFVDAVAWGNHEI